MVKEKTVIMRAVLTLAGLGLCVGPAWAAQVTWSLDPNRSSLSISGIVNNFTLQPQGSGSMTTSYSGTISTELFGDLNNPSGIRFLSGSADAGISGNWQPGIGGSSGSYAADYGVQANTGILGMVYGALRDLNLNLSSGQLSISGGGFNSTQINTILNSGNLDYSSFYGSGRTNLVGQGGANSASGGSLVVNSVSQVGTLTIPINMRIPLTGDVNGDIYLQGTLVGTAEISGTTPGTRLLEGYYEYSDTNRIHNDQTYPQGGQDAGRWWWGYGGSYGSYPKGYLGDGNNDNVAADWFVGDSPRGWRMVRFRGWSGYRVIDTIKATYKGDSGHQLTHTEIKITAEDGDHGQTWRHEERIVGPYKITDTYNPPALATKQVTVTMRLDTYPPGKWVPGLTEVEIYGHEVFPPQAEANGNYVFDADHLSMTVSSSGSSDPDGDALSYEWKVGGITAGTGPSPAISFALAGMEHPNSTSTLTLIVTDSSLLSSEDTTGLIYLNDVPDVLDAWGTIAADGSIELQALLDDPDLAANDLVPGFEELVWEFDQTRALFPSDVGDGFLIGNGTLSLETLLTIFGGFGSHTVYASVKDLAGAVASLAFEITVGIPGDTNGDGKVDIIDLGTLAGNYGATGNAIWAMGDFNNDGAVDVLDLGALAGNYGVGTDGLNFNADAADLALVPEPATVLLLCGGLFALLRRKQ